MNIYSWYATARWLYLHKIPLLPMIIKVLIRVIWGAVIPYQASIGRGTTFGYQALGVVIHKKAVIGENCHIGQNVTIGGTSGKMTVPVLGERVFVGANAVILGPIHIGDDSTIGAGAVVIKDVPSNCVAAGVPAKVIKTNVSAYPYAAQ